MVRKTRSRSVEFSEGRNEALSPRETSLDQGANQGEEGIQPREEVEGV